jgi:hypothetical protein
LNLNNNFDPQLKTAVMLHVPKSPQISSELVEHSNVLTPENRQNQMKHVLLDLQGISSKIHELQHTIRLKVIHKLLQCFYFIITVLVVFGK